MTLNEFISGLQKLSQLAGDLPVIFKDAEHEVETVLHTIGVNIDPTAGSAAGTVTVVHAPAAPVTAPAALAGTSQPDTGLTSAGV